MSSLSRRSFVKTVGTGSVGVMALPLIAARGSEATSGEVARRATLVTTADEATAPFRIAAPTALRLDSNENPNGPGEAALNAVRAMFVESPRYPDVPSTDVQAAIAKRYGIAVENVVVGAGSGEILRMAAYAFTRPAKALVTAAPTFEDPTRHAQMAGAQIRAVPVDGSLKLDLSAMAAQCSGAGLVFLCNPNNPTGTVHGARAIKDFVSRVTRSSPDTMILIDEAYHEYVEDPSYATSIPLAMEHPRVIVARTFSKIYGMAGLRVGYALGAPEAIKELQLQRLPNSINVLGAAAALATLGDAAHVQREQALNRAAKAFTKSFFERAGYRVIPSETNFIMVDVRRDSREFQEACRKQAVLVGRPFPPLTTLARISIGTMDEMQRATETFKQVLSVA